MSTDFEAYVVQADWHQLAHVLQTDRDGVVLHSEEPLDSLGPFATVRFAYGPAEKRRTCWATCAVVQQHDNRTNAVLALRYLAFYGGSDREPLEQFLATGVGREVQPHCFDRVDHGWYYHVTREAGFRSRAPGAPAPAVDADPNRVVATTVSASVRFPIAFAIVGRDGAPAKALAYTVTDHGLHVFTQTRLPAVGEHVMFVCSIVIHAHPARLQLSGEVYWSQEDHRTRAGGAFAVEIRGEGKDRRYWEEYVAMQTSTALPTA